MESNFESQSPENADREPSFRKSLNEKGNRKYRRHSSVSGSASPLSDGSRKHERSPSPAFPRDDPKRISDVHQRRKHGGRESDMDSGRSRHDKGGDSHRHSDRWSHKSSRDHRKHGDSSRYHKRVDEGERSYHRSSGYSRESRDGTRSDHVRQGSGEYDKSGDYRQNVAKYTKEKYDVQEYRGKDREESKKHSDKDSNMVRATSSRRHVSSYVDDYNRGGRDKHGKDGGGQDDMKNYGKSLGDHRSDDTYSAGEETRYDQHSNAGKETGGSHLKETQKSNIKDLDRGKGDAIEKRKHKGRESDRHEAKFSKAADGRDYSTSSNRRSCVENEQYQENPTRIDEDKESSPKKFKFVEADKGKNNEKDGQIVSKFPVAKDERLHSRSNLPHETTASMMTESAQPSNKAEVSHDLNAAKVAALKAAELVNRNLTGGGYMSTDQKKKLLWGSKKSTAVEESGHRWDVPLFSDRERQEKFKKLMGVKGDLKPEHKADNKDGGGLLQAEKQEQLQMDLEKQYTAGLRRRDGRTVGLGL